MMNRYSSTPFKCPPLEKLDSGKLALLTRGKNKRKAVIKVLITGGSLTGVILNTY